MRKDKDQLLLDLKQKKRNRSLRDVCQVLEAHGFEKRKASKENSLWKKGTVTLTLPTPHGGDPVLNPHYVSLVVRQIEVAEIQHAMERGEKENGEQD